MSSIVFIQNRNSHSWAVMDNKTGDLKGLIVERGSMAQDESPYLIYDVSFINKSFEILIYSGNELSEVQEFLLNFFKNEEL